jgi:glyoxylate utilization-related uncharacterized protein
LKVLLHAGVDGADAAVGHVSGCAQRGGGGWPRWTAYGSFRRCSANWRQAGGRARGGDDSSELFYILDGAFDLLAGDNVVVARTGDLLVVPPGSAHAFAAHHDSTAEALIIATPGIERFDYFRHVVRRRQGSEPPEVLLGLQDRFDTHFLHSPAWQRARPAA